MSQITPRFDLPHIRAVLACTLPSETSSDAPETVGAKQAAVAAILRERRDAVELLLIRRAEHPGDPWSGHIAFPGGRREASDLDLVHTARRETLEEVGLDLAQHGKLLGHLPDLQAIGRASPTGMVVSPRVFELSGKPPELSPNREVVEALWVPLDVLARGDVATTFEFPWQGQLLTMPGHEIHSDVSGETHILWGMTYRMLETLWELLRPSS